MGKQIKDLNIIDSIESNDKILVDRGGKGYSANLSELLSSTEIKDIDTIRTNAAKGATALQSVPEEYVTETELSNKGYATTVSVNNEINNINKNIGENNTSYTISERVTRLEDGFDAPDARSKVIWVGTSIPAGVGENNYPRMVGEALGCTVLNHCRAGSMLCSFPNASAAEEFPTLADLEQSMSKGYSLSMTVDEVENKYRSHITTLARQNGKSDEWIEEIMETFKWNSYERLIIKYIDGTYDTADTVIIDHGFNDRGYIYSLMAGTFANAEKDNISYFPPETVDGRTDVAYPYPGGNDGWWALNQIGEGLVYDINVWLNTLWNVVDDTKANWGGNYFAMMMYIIRRIWEVNPKIKIIIGNYFAKDSAIDETSVYKTRYILRANEQFAKWMGLLCVNPAEHTGIKNRVLPNGQTDMQLFAPDGVHPGTEPTGDSNRKIAGVYINALKGILYR